MSWEVPERIAIELVKGLSGGFAIFDPKDLTMKWCNQIFRKQTWFGGAVGGKNAQIVYLSDLFAEEDFTAAQDLFQIAINLGNAYDFQRNVRRGPSGNFPGELRFHRIVDSVGEQFISLEIVDLSLHKQFEDLEQKHHTMKDRFSSVMAEQADLHYTARLGTLSELGADMAHSLINPIAMCRDILERELAPLCDSNNQTKELQKVYNYLKGIEDLAVWFRKFSDPKLSETQQASIQELIQDALILNMSKLTKYSMSHRVRNYSGSNPCIVGVPFHIMSWIGGCVGEMLLICRNDRGPLDIAIRVVNHERITVTFSCPIDEKRRSDFNPKTLDLQRNRLPSSADWKWTVSKSEVEIVLDMECASEKGNSSQTQEFGNFNLVGQLLPSEVSETNDIKNPVSVEPNRNSKGIDKGDSSHPGENTSSNIPCILIVDDEDDIRRLVRRSLKMFNAEIWEAENGLKALDLLQKKSLTGDIDRLLAIVSDVRMPQMNGIQFLKAVKSKKLDCTFVFLSSNLVDPTETGNLGEEHGVYYLTKESKLERLKQLLASKFPK